MRGRLFFIVCSFTVCSVCVLAMAGELHRWVDADGVTHYSTNPPPGQVTEQHAIDTPRARNVLAPDGEDSFVALARLSAPTVCRQQREAQDQCVAKQVSAARDLGLLSDQTTDPALRFVIQTCQHQYLLDRHRPADFVAMRECVNRR